MIVLDKSLHRCSHNYYFLFIVKCPLDHYHVDPSKSVVTKVSLLAALL